MIEEHRRGVRVFQVVPPESLVAVLTRCLQWYPADRWPRVHSAVNELRPLAAEGLLAVFGPAMADEIEATLGRELAKLSADGLEPEAAG